MHTDYLDNPIKRGDVVIYPTAWGSSAADMNIGIVDTLDPIVTGLARQWDGSYRTMTTLQSYLQANKKDPTKYSIPKKRVERQGGGYDFVEDESKAYILRIYKLDASWNSKPSGKSTILKNVDRVTVVPLENAGPAFREKVLRAMDELAQMGVTF
jgi:hypothetical protein